MSTSETAEISRQCLDPPMGAASLVIRDRAGGVFGWFDERTLFPSVNTRAAIFKACGLLSLGQGDEILAPAYNCGSEIDPLLRSGATVSLYRVDRNTNIDLADIERRITGRTKAIYVTHYFGFPQPQIMALKALCERGGIFLIEDCALALFSKLATFGTALDIGKVDIRVPVHPVKRDGGAASE